MRKFLLGAVFAVLATPAMAQSDVTVKVITPAVTGNAGLRDLAMGFEKQRGIKVQVVFMSMGKMVEELKSGNPPADIVFLPYALMDQAQSDKDVAAGSRVNIGRVRIGLAVHKGDPAPDVSSVEKLAAALKSADSVMYSNPDPKNGSMSAQMIDKMLNRPEFAGVKRKISPYGEGGQALSRGEGQYALQLICEIVNHPDALTNAGPVPDSLGAYIDSAAAVSSRAPHPTEAAQFLKYATQDGTYSLWLGTGLERMK
jgi:ABC-type molybdate transport system substrate-binding protein